jgi:long-chain acyl-CoA synthetase
MTTARAWHDLYEPGIPPEIEIPAGTMLDRFDATVRRLGEGPLVVYFDTDLSARAIDRTSDAFACALASLGVTAGDRIALLLQNVPQFVIGTVAAWKVGAIVTSPNPMLKHRELEHVLTDSGARVLITLESLFESVASEVVGSTAVADVITTSALDFLQRRPRLLADSKRVRTAGAHDLVELIDRFDGQRPNRPRIAPTDPAFLAYTAGTTGPSKGAINTHANVVFATEVFRRWHGLDRDDAILGISPLFHMTGLAAHLGISVSAGIPLLLSYRFEAETVLEQSLRRRPTFTVGAITAYVALVDHPKFRREALACIEKAITGGAPTAPAVLAHYEDRTGVRLRNGYGLTESTSPALQTPGHLQPPVDADGGGLSIGVPVFNTDCRVVDESGKVLGPGEAGELLLAGPQVIPGYWKKPDETATALRDGWLHTGDVGFVDEDGWFYLVDRKKDLINTSGFKVWPREVEDVLYEHDGIAEAAVLGVDDAYRGEAVCAYVALRPGSAASPEELIAFCGDRLAAYKRPRRIVVLDELPKSPAGKILRRALREMADPSDGASAPDVLQAPGRG